MTSTFIRQVKWLQQANFPAPLFIPVAEWLLVTVRWQDGEERSDRNGQNNPHSSKAGMPCMHEVSHWLKRISRKIGIKVVFSACGINILVFAVNEIRNIYDALKNAQARLFMRYHFCAAAATSWKQANACILT